MAEFITEKCNRQIVVWLPEEWLDELDRTAAREMISRLAVIRSFIKAGIEKSERGVKTTVP